MKVDLKKIKPIGVVLVLLIGVLTIVTLFSADFSVPPRYTPMHDTEYYKQSPEHMELLRIEVQDNVLPDIPGIIGCETAPDGSAVVLRIKWSELDKVKAVITRDFDPVLFQFMAVGD